MDLEDREEDHKVEVGRLQSEVAAAVARLEAQGESREKVGVHHGRLGQRAPVFVLHSPQGNLEKHNRCLSSFLQ
jgi:hypothetical protein